MTEPHQWTIHHFTQNNPDGEGRDDVSALLRRIADTLDSYGAVEVQDIVFYNEVTPEGTWPKMTVYYYPEDDTRSQDRYGQAP